MDLALQAHNPPPHPVSTLSEQETSTLDFRRLTLAPCTPIPAHSGAPHFHHSQTHPPPAWPVLQCSSTLPDPFLASHLTSSLWDPDIAQINPQPLKLPPTLDITLLCPRYLFLDGLGLSDSKELPPHSASLSRQYPPQSPSHRDGAKTQFPRVCDSCFLFVCCSLQSAQTTRCLKRVCSRHCIPGWCVLAAQQLGVPCDTEQVKDSQAHSLPNVLRSRGSISGNPSSPKTAPK